jgi:hypothetical protein
MRRILTAVLLVAAAQAQAADLPISAFFGEWRGSAVSESEVSVNFSLTPRDIGVAVRPAGQGFALTWNTVQRQKGDPRNPEEELKSATVEFQPVRAGVWRAAGAEDPAASGKPYLWAHVDGQTLVVNGLQIGPDGGHELQVYRRTLSGGGMALEFARIVDGEPVRTAKGQLVKIAN